MEIVNYGICFSGYKRFCIRICLYEGNSYRDHHNSEL